MTRALPFLILILMLAAGCDGGPSRDALAKRNRELAATADPAVTAALADPIMTDRDLEVADDSRRVRTVAGPAQALYPPRIPANAAIWSAIDGLGATRRCETGFATGDAWASRMPASFAVLPGATLIGAAGDDAPGCRARLIAVRTAVAGAAIGNWYASRARAAGYTAQAQRRGRDLVFGGRRSRDGASWYLVVTPGAGGNEAALLATGG